MVIKLQVKTAQPSVSLEPRLGYGFRPERKSSLIEQLQILAGCAITGAILGLSAPGLNEWYLAWCGLVPLMLFILKSDSVARAALRAFTFGVFYNAVYLNWFLTVKSPWAIALPQYPILTGIYWLLFCSIHQGIIFAVFGFLVRKIQLAPGFAPSFGLGGMRWPGLLVIPLLWVLLFNKIGNSSLFIGIPWSMIEYSQYEQTAFLQVAKLIGGIGIGALIVMFNVALTGIILTLLERGKFNSMRVASPHPELLDTGSFARPDLTPTNGHLVYSSLRSAFATGAIVIGLVGLCWFYGKQEIERADGTPARKPVSVSLLQGNVSMKLDDISPAQLAALYIGLTRQVPPGICVWPEWSVPLDIPNTPQLLEVLGKFTKSQQQSWLIGAVEHDGVGSAHNVVCAFDEVRGALDAPYRKRMLVPFGEQVPTVIAQTGLNKIFNTAGPGKRDYLPGDVCGIFDLKQGKVGTVICLEIASPEFVTETVRNGAELIADSSNTVWFESDMVGKQMVAFSVMRAAESSRAVAFTTIHGPSAIIDPQGRILKSTASHKAQTCSQTVDFKSELTPFVQWFR